MKESDNLGMYKKKKRSSFACKIEKLTPKLLIIITLFHLLNLPKW